MVGALSGTAVAKTVGSGLVQAVSITQVTIIAALIAAIVWEFNHMVSRASHLFKPCDPVGCGWRGNCHIRIQRYYFERVCIKSS